MRLPFSSRYLFSGLLVALFLSPSSSILCQQTFAPITDIGRIAVNDIARNANGDLLVAGSGGMFIRGGIDEMWERIDFPHEVYRFYVTGDSTILAGSVRGIQRSTDGGHTWRLVANVADVGDFSVNGSGTIMAVPYMERDNLTGFVYVSDDGGLSWSPFSTRFGSLTGNNVVSIGDLFFIGSASGLKITYNNGDVWETTRLIDSVGSLIVTETGTLVATTGNEIRRDIVWESHDTGRSWVKVDSLPGVRSLHPGTGDEYFLTVTSSYGFPDEDGMGLWSRKVGVEGRELLYGTDGIVDVHIQGSELLIAENYRIRSGSNEGGEWTDVTGEIMAIAPGDVIPTPNGHVYAMIADSLSFVSGNSRIRYALYSSDDNGETWSHRAAAFDPERVVADELGNLYVVNAKIEWMKNENDAWKVRGERFETFRLDGRDGSFTLFRKGELEKIASDRSGVVATLFRDSAQATHFRELIVSLDSGTTWKGFGEEGYPFSGLDSLPSVRSFAIAADGAVVAGVSGSGLTGTYRFTLESEGSTTTISNDQLVPPSIVRMDDDRLLMTSYLTGDGLFRSSDNGATWEPIAPGQRMVSAIPLGDGTLFADGRFFSQDYGDSWFGSESFRKVIRGRDRILYAINGGANGYRKSSSNGTLWLDANFKGLSGYPTDLEVSSDGYLFVATSEGLFRTVLPSSVRGLATQRSSEGLTLAIRGDQIVLSGEVVSRSGATGAIYDPAGRLVSRIELLRSGSNEMIATLDTGELPIGTLLLVVRSGDRQVSTLLMR